MYLYTQLATQGVERGKGVGEGLCYVIMSFVQRPRGQEVPVCCDILRELMEGEISTFLITQRTFGRYYNSKIFPGTFVLLNYQPLRVSPRLQRVFLLRDLA